MNRLAREGFLVLPGDPAVAAWAAAAAPLARAVLVDPVARAQSLRHGQSWFVGLDALPNAPDGSIGGVPLAGGWQAHVPAVATWHRAQLSVILPGYPRQDPTESEAAHRFRLHRDAAHLDGLLAEGPDKRRHLREPHAFVLGIGLNRVGPGASPLVVWEGSPQVIRTAFSAAFQGLPPSDWPDVDVTEVYSAARAQVFAACRRREIVPQIGEAVLVHRLAIHGVAPWQPGAAAPPEGRMVAYFRPLLPDFGAWLADDAAD